MFISPRKNRLPSQAKPKSSGDNVNAALKLVEGAAPFPVDKVTEDVACHCRALQGCQGYRGDVNELRCVSGGSVGGCEEGARLESDYR